MDENIQVLNAEIKSAKWTYGKTLSHWIMLDGEGWSCMFGGIDLSGEKAGVWVNALMKMLDVSELSEKDLIGKIIRIQVTKEDNEQIKLIAIGHPIKNNWLNPEELFANVSE